MDSTRKPIVLLVEDEILIAMSGKLTLEQAGYTVLTAHSGEQAVEVVKSGAEIDLVLMDIDLGAGMDGTQAAEIILSERDIPLVFLSSHTEPEMVARTDRVGSYGYVVKNSGTTVVMASINMAFKLHKALLERKQAEAALRNLNQAMGSRLSAIVDSTGDIASLSLEQIIDGQALQEIFDDFHRLTGVPGAVVDMQGKVLVASGWQDICVKFHRCSPEAAQHCRESDLELAAGVAAGRYKTYKCKNNLWDVATPIMAGERHVGNIYTGQFFFEDDPPDREFFRRQARRYGFDEDAYLEALDRTPRLSRDMVDTAMSFFTKLAALVSTLSLQTLHLSRESYQKDRALEQQRAAEERVQSLVQEKETLLQEILHRIKNNMTTMTSLLTLQMAGTQEPAVTGALGDALSRFQSMQVLYENLYSIEAGSTLSIVEYLQAVAGQVMPLFPLSDKVSCTVVLEQPNGEEAATCVLDAKRLSTLGLIVNELLTNSMKYAFHDLDHGVLELRISCAGALIQVCVCDNGPGLPAGLDPAASSGLGLSLVRELALQLKGSIRFESSPGTGMRAILEFPQDL